MKQLITLFLCLSLGCFLCGNPRFFKLLSIPTHLTGDGLFCFFERIKQSLFLFTSTLMRQVGCFFDRFEQSLHSFNPCSDPFADLGSIIVICLRLNVQHSGLFADGFHILNHRIGFLLRYFFVARSASDNFFKLSRFHVLSS
nr:MAG TPA: hypothetical protein [Caudoviricetes sp.]